VITGEVGVGKTVGRIAFIALERARISVQTYHAFCMGILRTHGRLLTGRPARMLVPDRETP
jgi:hypothetical protein